LEAVWADAHFYCVQSLIKRLVLRIYHLGDSLV
jgi:hypothetical protein